MNPYEAADMVLSELIETILKRSIQYGFTDQAAFKDIIAVIELYRNHMRSKNA